MRTIMGFCGTCSDITDFTKGLMQAAPRGHGESRIVDVGHGLLGYRRRASGEHPAVELQPLTLDGSYAVCSGDFVSYGGLRAGLQARGYTFRSRCDCELLLPLYREYGVNMFGMLKGRHPVRPRQRGVHRRPRQRRQPPSVLRAGRCREHGVCQ